MNKIICRALALIIASVVVYSQYHFENTKNLILFLAFMCSLLAFGEFEPNDLLETFNYKEINTLRISITWLGKFFETLSFIFYITYFMMDWYLI